MSAPKSTEAHSPEPWVRDDFGNMRDATGQRVALTGFSLSAGYDPSGVPEANDRRVGACLAACRGLPTAALEAGKLAEALRCADWLATCVDGLGKHPVRGLDEAVESVRYSLRALKETP